jgi:transposase
MTEKTRETPRAIHVIGCDVAKDTVVMCDSATGTVHTVDNTMKALRPILRRMAPAFVVCEATGGYEAALLAAAVREGLPAHRGDPRKISAFLRSLRSVAKTDPIDAKGLARYGQERHDQLPLWQPPAKIQQTLQQLVRLRADMVASRADYARRLKAPGAAAAKTHILTLIRSFDSRITALSSQISRLVTADTRISLMVNTIIQIPGCGPITATTLAATMPELGQLSGRQAAALSGTAPHPRDSGQHKAYRAVRGGRQDIKHALFMAALAASRHNPQLKPFYDRLIANGKKPIVAIVATARKLITIINAKIRDQISIQLNQLS